MRVAIVIFLLKVSGATLYVLFQYNQMNFDARLHLREQYVALCIWLRMHYTSRYR